MYGQGFSFSGVTFLANNTLTGADNGLSLDAIGATAQLGQDINAAGNPAILLNNREIPIDNFIVQLLGQSGRRTVLGGIFAGGVFTSQGAGLTLSISTVADPGAVCEFIMNDEQGLGFNNSYMAFVNNYLFWSVSGDRVLEKDFTQNNYLILGSDAFTLTNPLGDFNGGVVTGRLGAKRAQQNFPGGSASNLDQSASNALFTDTSSAAGMAYTLPASPPDGTTFIFAVNDNKSIDILNQPGQPINVGGVLSSDPGGDVFSVAQGSVIRLTYLVNNIGGGTWFAEYVSGTWSIT